MKKLYFIVGSQDLYGEECLKQVAEDSRQFLLCSGKLRFHGPVRFREIRGSPVTVHVQVRHGVIQADAVLDDRPCGCLRFRAFHQDGVIPLPVRLLGDGHGF